MKIVQIIGGLGNQMFQYALAVALRNKFDDEVKIDTSFFNGYHLHNGFELQRIFNTTIPVATKKEVRNVYHHFIGHYMLCRIYKHLFPKKQNEFREVRATAFDPKLFSEDIDAYYDGYWQDYRYLYSFRESIKKEFSWKGPLSSVNKDLYNKLLHNNSISVHVRGGDYNNHPVFGGICDIEYYRKAFKILNKSIDDNTIIVFFSNDQDYCRKEIVPLLNAGQPIIVDWNQGKNSYIDMRLMSACKTNIIANSTFSWWGAFLNENENYQVIAPSKWTNTNQSAERCLPDWIKI